MVNIDKKVARSARKLSKNYSDILWYKPSSKEFHVVHDGATPDRSVPVRVPPMEIPAAVDRLARDGYLHTVSSSPDGERYFSITPELLHRFAFWFDEITKKFWVGFVTGFATAIATGAVTWFIMRASGWLQLFQ